jgi:hypothetical protein
MTEPDTKELDALLGSLNTSAEPFQTLWFSFLGLTLYLAIAALATTHRNLLLGERATLPTRLIRNYTGPGSKTRYSSRRLSGGGGSAGAPCSR